MTNQQINDSGRRDSESKPEDHRCAPASVLDRAVTLVFMAFIWLPLLTMVVFPTSESSAENRELAKFPGTHGTEISRTQLEEYVKDHLGFRTTFVNAHNQVKLVAFKAVNEKVIAGKDDWLFINNGRVVSAYTGDLKCTPQVVASWRQTLKQRAEYLEQRDIPYGFIAVPDKQFIHPEHLPDSIRRGTECYTDRLLQGISDDVNVISLFDALHSAKDQGDLFYKRDTHWNGRGTAVGFKAIISRLSQFVPGFENEVPCELEIVVREDFPRKNDLGKLIGCGPLPQPTIYAAPVQQNAKRTDPPSKYVALEEYYKKETRAIEVYANDSERVRGRRLVMFHTSFSHGTLNRLLAEHFERAVFVRHSPKHFLAFHKLLIDEEQPTLVLNEIPTRYLTRNPATAYRTEEWSNPSIQIASEGESQRR
ncbi:MAG: hypothetical protein KDB27_13965 [Planctomycetales bacterium]|nr:hypothetical protein [Planctomycetales bacterium]